jgi:hypothetical protein
VELLGWIKTVGGLRKTRHRGRDLVEWFFVFAATAYNLVLVRRTGTQFHSIDLKRCRSQVGISEISPETMSGASVEAIT